MANLLSWSGGLSLQKKKDENQLNSNSIISAMRSNPLQAARIFNDQIRANKANGFKLPTSSSDLTNNNAFQAQQEEQQRRQQEEQRRQQQLEQMRQQQQERQQQEQQRRLQQQQEQQQKQQQLLNSSLGGGLLSKLQNADKKPVTQTASFDQPRPATVVNQNMLNQLSKVDGGNTTVNAFNNANRLAKLASDKLKQEENDIINRYGEEYRDALRQYNKASGDEQADLTERTKNALINQREKLRRGDSDASEERIKELSNLVSLYENHGRTKGKSFGKQLGDWLTSGGIAGDIGGNALTEALGNVTGNEDETKAHLEQLQNKRTDLGAVGAANAVLSGVGNTALNLTTGGTYGLANAGVGGANTLYGLDDKVLDYDAFGKPYMREKTGGERASEIGNAALNAGFALAGKAGIGPGLGKGSLKDIARYAWQEPLWAGGTTLAQEGFGNLGKNKNFFDYDWENVSKNFATNVGQDIGMDLFNLGRARAQTKVNANSEANNGSKILQELTKKQLDKAIKNNPDLQNRIIDATDNRIIDDYNNSLRPEISRAIQNGVDNNMDGFVMRKNVFDDLNSTRASEGKDALSRRQTTLYSTGTGENGHYRSHEKQLGGVEGVVDAMRQTVGGKDTTAYPAKYKNSILANDTANQGKYPASTVIDNDGGVLSVSGRTDKQIKKYAQQKSDLKDSLGGRSSTTMSYPEGTSPELRFSGRQATKTNIAQNGENVNNSVAKLADLGYDVSKEIGSRAKKVAKKVAGVANKHPLGGTTRMVDGSGMSDRFGNKFAEEDVPVSQLRRSTEFQPRTTESGKATSDSVYKNGYQEGRVDQPMLVRKMADGTYEVLGGHSRTEGLERRAAEGLKNPDTVKARVYEGISDKQALQIAQAANQGGQYESIIDMAKSISDARKAGIEPSVQRQNMVKGYTMDDYEKLNNVLTGDSRLKDLVFQGAISQEDMLSIARTARKLNFDAERAQNLVRTAYDRGKFNRKGIEAVMKSLTNKQKNAEYKESENSLFDMTDYGKAVDSQDEILQAERDLRNKRTLENSANRVLKNFDNLDEPTRQSLLQRLRELADNQASEAQAKKTTRAEAPKEELPSFEDFSKSLYPDEQATNTRNNTGATEAEMAKDGLAGVENKNKKVMDTSKVENPAKDAIDSGTKMSTQEFFEASKINNNDLAAIKKNYPNEYKSVKQLLKAGVTPETFNDAVFNKDGSHKSAFNGREIPPMRAMFELAYNYNKATDAGSAKNQNKANVFEGDAIKENTTKKSGLADNISKNNAFSDEVREALAKNPVEYKPTTNEERLARANEILSSKSFDEVDKYLRNNYFDVKDKYRNSGDTVLAGEFAKMLDADGQYGRATEIVQKMSEIATKQGQQIQALSIMANRSPEGIANMAQSAIQKGGGKVDGEVRKQIVSNTQEIGKIRTKMAELNTENSDVSYKIMNGEGDLPSLRKRQMEIGQEYRRCLDQEGRSFANLSKTVNDNSKKDAGDIFGSVWRAGLLSGPRTHTGNAVSNIFQNALNAGADRIASGLDWARVKVKGGEREIVSSAGGRGKGVKRGLKAAAEVLKTGDNLWEGTERVTSSKPNSWGFGGELKFKNKIANAMIAKPTNFVFRAMSAGDLPFRYSAFENAIRTEAKRQGMNQGYKGQALEDYINSRVATPDPDLQAYGIKKGNESVYDADTILARVMAGYDKVANGLENKAGRFGMKTAKTLLTPFVKVPSKVLSTAIDYSPMGSVQAIVKKVGSKKYTTAQFETDLAKSGLGTGTFVGLGYALSSAGLITGNYPDDDKERDRWKNEGIEPNSIKIGDKYVSLNYLGPTAILMGMGAGVQKRQERGEDPFTMSIGAIGDTVNSFLGQSYVQGLNDAVNVAKDPQRYGPKFANSIARGAVPNILRQTATATDTKQRQVDTPLESIISGIPGLSQTLNAKVDTYGREIENKQTMPLGQMWDALKISNSRETNDVIDEVSRLHSVDTGNKDLQVTPPTQDKSVSVNGTNVKLTGGQRAQLQKDTGAAALKFMQQVMDSEKYSGMSDEDKAKALKKAREDAQSEARKQFIAVNNITSDNNPGTQISGGEVEGDFAVKAITNTLSNTEGKKAIIANNSLSKEGALILDKYNSMSKADWEDYINGSSAESAAAEYNLAKAKYDNQIANDELNDAQKIRKEKELRKLEVSKDWEKKYRDAYGLANSKSDMQEYLAGLDDDARAETVGILNGLNRAMYDAGVIQASTYKTRNNAINGTTTAKSSSKKGSKKSSGGISSSEASAIKSLASTMVKNTDTTKVNTPKAPETQRKMSRTKSGNKTSLASYTPSGAKKVTVTKGAKRSIA